MGASSRLKINIDRYAHMRAKALFARKLARGGCGDLPAAPLDVARRKSRRIVFWLITLSAATFLASFGLLALSFTGALNLDRFAPAIEASLAKNVFPGDKVSLGALRLKREGWAAAVSFANLSVSDSNGRMIVLAPRGTLGVDALALFTGSVRLRRVELDGLDLKIAIKPDGSVSVAGAQPSEQPAAASVAHTNLADLRAAFADLRLIAVRDARMTITRESDGATLAYEQVSAGFERRGGDVGVTIGGRGPSGRFSVNALLQGGAKPHFSAAAKDLAVSDLLAFAPKELPFSYDAPLEFQAEGDVGPDGAPRALKGHIALGAGRLAQRGGDMLQTVIDEVGVSFAWDAAAARYSVSDAHVVAGDSHATLSGFLTPPTGEDGPWMASLKTDDAMIGPGKPGEAPLPVKATIEAQAATRSGDFKITDLAISGPTALADIKLETAPDGTGRSFKAELSIMKGLAVEVIRMWPRLIVSDTRDWARDHVVSGDFAPSTITADFDAASIDALTHKRAVAAERVRGDVHIASAALQLFPPGTIGPPLNVIDATVSFDGKSIGATASAAVLDFSATRKVKAKDLSFTIPDTTPAARVPAHISLHMFAGADGVAELMLREPVRSFLGAPLDPALVKGVADAMVSVDFPLGQHVLPSEWKIGINGALTNFTLEQALGPQKFDNATLAVTLDPTTFKITGQGQFLGVPATLDAVKVGKDPGVATIAFALDNAARKRLGLPVGANLDGTVGFKVRAPWTRTGADVELDLSRAALSAPVLGVIKAAGKQGKATFSVKTVDSGITLQNIVVDAGFLGAKGGALLGADGTVRSVSLSSLRIAGSDDMHVDVIDDHSVWRVNAKGGQIDAKPIIQNFLQKSPASGNGVFGADVAFDGQFSSAVGAKGTVLNQVHVSAIETAGAVKRLALQGRLGLGTLTYARDETGKAQAHVGDMGAFLRYLDIYSRMEGGVLDADLKSAAGVETGQLELRKFSVRGEPALRQLAGASRPANADAKGQTPFDPDMVTFDKLKATFTHGNGRVDVSDAVVYNQLVGMTTQGYIDFAHNSIDLSGEFIPAYGVNTLVGHIPILGVILSGGSNEGIFAVNYRLAGALDKSTLTVDPLSAAAPGILRKVLGVIDGTARMTPAAGDPTAAQ